MKQIIDTDTALGPVNSFFLHGIPNDLAKSNTPRKQCSFILQFHEYFRFHLKSVSQIFLNELKSDVPFLDFWANYAMA